MALCHNCVQLFEALVGDESLCAGAVGDVFELV